jgi:hypothetical protein
MHFLISYEGMVRQQDNELEATQDCLRLTMDRIRYLGRKRSNNNSKDDEADEENVPEGILTYLQMRRCLLRLGYTWNKHPSTSSSSSHDYQDDDISISSAHSSTTSTSNASGKVYGGRHGALMKAAKRDIIATDNQLIMLLCTLVEMEELDRVRREERMEMEEEDDDDMDGGNVIRRIVGTNDANSPYRRGLFLPEFIQAYKLIISGMQSLSSIPTNNNSKQGGGVDLSLRLRERTKGLLRPFGPNAKLYTDAATSIGKYHQTPTKQSARRNNVTPSPSSNSNTSGGGRDGLASPVKQRLFASSSPANTKLANNNVVINLKDGLSSPRLTDDKLRKLIHSKDSTLAKIMEEHELEMNAMNSSMEELQLRESTARRALVKRRRRTRLTALGVGCVLLVGGIYLDLQRREMVAREIASGREGERKKDAETIALLTEEREKIQVKVADLEGTARYQENRLKGIESSMSDMEKEIEELELKWWIDQAEIGRCKIATKELDGGIVQVQMEAKELEEEKEWCQNRLRGRDRELDSLEHASVELSEGKGVVVAVSTGTGSGDINNKPVKLEMKYNQSIRNAMILRQSYSAIGGVAASVVLKALMPGAFRFWTPKSVATVATTAAPKQWMNINVAWVDRIHAVTVALLVLRTAALFILP